MYSWIYYVQGCSPEVPSDPSGWHKSRRVPGLSLERVDGLFQEGCMEWVEDSGKLDLEAAVVTGQVVRVGKGQRESETKE